MTTSRALTRRYRLRAIGMSGLVLFATVVVVGQLTPGYSHFSETVSRLASSGQPFALVARLGLALYGVLVIAGAQPLGDVVPGRERFLGGLIGVFGGAAVTAGIAPKDAPLAAHTVASRVHVDATIVGGAAVIMAMVVVAACAPNRIARQTAAVATILAGGSLIIFRLSWGSGIYGLAERFLLASPALWLVVLALQVSSIDRQDRLATVSG